MYFDLTCHGLVDVDVSKKGGKMTICHKGWEYDVDVEYKIYCGYIGDPAVICGTKDVRDVDIYSITAELNGRPIKWPGALNKLSELAIKQILGA